MPGLGMRAFVNGTRVAVGNSRLLYVKAAQSAGADLQAQGKTLLWLKVNVQLAGVLAAEDTLRPEVPAALTEARTLASGRLNCLLAILNEPRPLWQKN